MLERDDVVVAGLVGESGRRVWRSGSCVDGDYIEHRACSEEGALESLRVRRDGRDLDTVVGRMVSIESAWDRVLHSVAAYRAPMAAIRLSMASGTCPELALPVLRLTSAMIERGDVVGTPLLL